MANPLNALPDKDSPTLPAFDPRHWLRLWFGVSQPVTPAVYAVSGFALMLLKYGVETAAIWTYTSAVLKPWQFFNPLVSERAELLHAAPEWLPWLLFVWTLPFLWIAVTMSVRRAADAGMSPWLGLVVLVPLVNLVFMVAMCFAPSRFGQPWMTSDRPSSNEERAKSAALAVGLSIVIGGIMLVASVYLLQSYGASLFLGTPLLMGASAAYLYNRPYPRTTASSLGIGLLAVLFAEVAMLLFALEGFICLAMAVPLVLPIGALGGMIGKAIADSTRRPSADLLAAVVVLPLLAGGESLLVNSTEYMVLSAVEIDAPATVVWPHVVDFPDLPPGKPWYFRWGIACPERARIEGSGVGATRYCEFTTGAFVEPITTWDEPHRLAFDVTEQPAPMFELSPYRHVHPPHLDGYLQSTRGEFLLVELSDGRTRLEGRTWYRFKMFPQWYWTPWSNFFIHRIHERVLLHVKRLAESD